MQVALQARLRRAVCIDASFGDPSSDASLIIEQKPKSPEVRNPCLDYLITMTFCSNAQMETRLDIRVASTQ